MPPRPDPNVEYLCHTCKWRTGYYARMERHVDAHGGGRIEILIPIRRS